MEVIEASTEEFDDIVALFKNYRFALQERRWYDWKYFGNPAGNARPFKITTGGKIVGAGAVMPQRLTYRGAQVAGVQAVDCLLGWELRGKGNFNELMHFLTAQKPPGIRENCFYLSFPSLIASVKAHENAGWHRLANFSMITCLLTPAPLFKNKPMPAIQKGLELVWRPFRRSVCGPSASAITLKPADGASFDFSALIDPNKVSGDRSADFMKWRVQDNPKDRIRTLLIYEQDRFAGYAVCKSAGSAVEVTEIRLKGAKIACVQALLRYIYTQSWGSSVDFWSFGESAIQKMLPRLGFFRRTSNGALFVHNVAALDLPADPAIWDITYLDSDW